jgi:hypothetical protein
VGDGLTEIGSPGRALSIADHHEVEVLCPYRWAFSAYFSRSTGMLMVVVTMVVFMDS